MDKISLKMKLRILSGFLLIALIAVGSISYITSSKTGVMYDDVIANSLPKELLINSYYSRFLEIRMNLRNLGLPGISPKDVADSEAKIVAALNAQKEILKSYEALEMDDGQAKLYKEFRDSWADFEAVGVRVMALSKTGTDADHKAMVNIFFTDCPDKAGVFMAASTKLTEHHKEEARREISSAKGISSKGQLIIGIAAIVSILTGSVVALRFSSKLTKDLSLVSTTISESASQIMEGSGELSESSAKLSDSSSQSAASLEETVASIEEITSIAKKTVVENREASSLSAASRESAEKGKVPLSASLNQCQISRRVLAR